MLWFTLQYFPTYFLLKNNKLLKLKVRVTSWNNQRFHKPWTFSTTMNFTNKWFGSYRSKADIKLLAKFAVRQMSNRTIDTFLGWTQLFLNACPLFYSEVIKHLQLSFRAYSIFFMIAWNLLQWLNFGHIHLYQPILSHFQISSSNIWIFWTHFFASKKSEFFGSKQNVR